MLKILQARLQQYVNRELPDVQTGFRRGRGTRDKIANIHWIIEKAREFQKNAYFCFIDHAKAFDYVAAAKSLQSCPTLCNPIDSSPPGSSILGILQARILEWVAISLSKKNIFFCFIDCAKGFDCVDDNNYGKFWKRWEYQTTWPASSETYMQVRKQQLELDIEQQTGSK